ncbi:glucokinase [Cocleimonas sp. KMM 6892]|uniref:glucokinase n=1 Tax=unclassified Cocleimonas TaxID=2639732 RepID=UPI002DBBC651|nr:MULTISPECIES: glucokinase [unclassified Cocleimonas]MEB8433758.1 glucokinase [Cocleimonas sp. KMM 6892]MEC4716569.1 glucokinase [Cocleimonas sp. KMM 6895]MEC4746276.1 glucokinase [Cocleimonas sp. KMM 6896]
MNAKAKSKLPANKRVIADIGGTNARFALLTSNKFIQNEKVLAVGDYPDFASAYKDYLQQVNNPQVLEAAIAIANPIDGDRIKMTNHDWDFSIEQTRQDLSLDSLVFKNDFEALALSIPHLAREDCHQIGSGEIKQDAPIGILGPGTGLGVAGLIFSGEEWLPLAGEGGHVSLSPTTQRECQILETCWKEFQHVSAERLISGSGLQRLYLAICELDQVDAKPDLTPKDISQYALDQTNKQCEETLEVFCALLGVVAGNLALTLGAKGGIYIGGGIIPKLGSYFDNSLFRERFESKGRFKDYLKDIPVFVIKSEHPALVGISQVFD